MKAPSLLSRPIPRPQLPGNLATRLASVFGLISLLAVTAMGLSIYFLTDHYLRSQSQDNLDDLASFYAAYTATTAADDARLGAVAPQIASFFALQANYDVRLFSSRNGALLAATRDIGSLPSNAALSVLGRRRSSLFLAASYDHPDRLYAVRSVAAPDGDVLAVVEVSRVTAEMQSFLRTLRLVLVGAGSLALAAALLASVLLARQVTRPLSQMELATQAIANGDLDRRLEATSSDEIGRLASSINQMAADLARLEAARREFIAKISHDLRTPLTAIKGLAINLQDGAPDEMQASLVTLEEQADRLARLVNDLLSLSRLQRGELLLRRTRTDLAAVAHSAVAIASEKARRLGVALMLDVADGLPPVSGDADRLQQVAVNLLDNALKATPAGGTVRVSVFAASSEATVTVTDVGAGLTEEEAARAFEPFYHGPKGGVGLGLTIAQEIIGAHGGRIWLRARPEGGAEAGFSVPGEEPRAGGDVPAG
jgi:signal transduction histidine kinase